MIIREPVAAGRFYPGSASQLDQEIASFLAMPGINAKMQKPWALMLPHAGYVYCGEIIGKTLANVELPSNLIILCPNHTGRGQALGVWTLGAWRTPLGIVPVNQHLAAELIATQTGYQPDQISHLGEHSIEVLLPFLQKKVADLAIVPVCIGTQNPQILKKAARGLASVIRADPENIAIIVSSDMNHYENEKITFAKDQLALDAILADKPDELLRTVSANHISMCGAGPMALALYAAQYCGNARAELVAHGTSAKASSDYDHTVGYAGMEVFMDA